MTTMYHSSLSFVKEKKYTVIGVVSAFYEDDNPNKETLIGLLDEKADALNADGIIAIRFTCASTRTDDYPNMIVYGTAIKFED